MQTLIQKQQQLDSLLKDLGSVVLAFSGGVDSTYLLSRAHMVLKDHLLVVIACGPIFPKNENLEALEFVQSRKIPYKTIDTNILEIGEFIANSEERCFICKMRLFESIIAIAENNNYTRVVDGTNADDTSDYRPGMKALKILGVRSPLLEVGLKKEEIRILSKLVDLSTWDKPSMACLATRFPYGEEINVDKLRRVEKAEKLLASAGYKQYRVRSHGNLARIEVLSTDLEKIVVPKMRTQLTADIKALGFTYICLDLEGYRSGALNEVLDNNAPKGK